MFAFNDILQKIEQEITRLQFTYPPKSLYDPIEYILSLGGKRIRPALVLMACNLYKENVDTAVNPALGLEVFHNFTLLHDDIMDNATKRRNHPTVHVKWNDNTAILSGDAMLIKSLQYVAQTDSQHFKDVLDLFNATALEVCEGQQYDMEFEQRDAVSEAEYIEMIRLKTAVLLASSMKIGAIIGGASETEANGLYSFALNVGMAFQLQDDLLDVYGDENHFGKSIGGDIAANKKTYLLIKARELANEQQTAELNKWLKATEFVRETKISAVRGIYDQLEIHSVVTQKISHFFIEAMQSLHDLNLGKDNRTFLENFATVLLQRDR